jgi:hypothetical protein
VRGSADRLSRRFTETIGRACYENAGHSPQL